MSEHLQYLLEQYFRKEQTAEEKAELLKLLALPENAEIVKAWIDEGFSRELPSYNMDPAAAADILEAILPQEPAVVRKPLYQLPVFRYAAAILLLLSVGAAVYLLNKPSRTTISGFPSFDTQGSCGLRVPTGKREDSIVNMRIVDGIVTLSIPVSWQYMLTLPDGSRVYLNALSSITYPRTFEGNRKEVSVEGEAFFIIADSSRENFYVTAKGQKFRSPAGGSFNINAYEEQAIARIDSSGNPLWKEGYFVFQKATTREAVEELARWYGWKVKYEKEIPAINFNGSFCRTASEKDALNYLKYSQLHFRKEGDQLIIL